MSTDRELLELAAKAYASKDIRKLNFGAWFNDGRGTYWNPLADDGDALRLAVKLKMTVMPGIAYSDMAGFMTQPPSEPGCGVKETRRAIVRAAAEIGRAMS